MVTLLISTREFKSREIAQTHIYVIMHSLQVSFYTPLLQPLAESYGQYGFWHWFRDVKR